MSVFGAISIGLREIFAHKLRSSLTLFCVLLGVASVVLTVGYMQGLTAQWRASLQERGGVERVSVDVWEVPDEQEPYEVKSPGHRPSDAVQLKKLVKYVRHAVPRMEERFLITRGRNRDRTEVEGCLPETQAIKRIEPAEGRFITDHDDATAAQVVVLGDFVRDNLFEPDEVALGSYVRIGGLLFEVVGVLPEYVAMMGDWNMLRWKNDVAYIPLRTFLERLNGSPQTQGIDIQIDDARNLAAATSAIENTMRGLHRGIEDFRVDTNQEWAADLDKTEKSQVTTGAAVSLITIVIGGIGIMNLMLASINERVREIGIRKAIGARGRDIFLQFSVESVTLCVLGGVFGVAVGQGAIHILQEVIEEGNRPVYSTLGVAMGFSASVVIGILAGLYPAVKAASLDPIEALRHE